MATRIKLAVDLSGPFFNQPGARLAVRQFLDDTKAEVAAIGEDEIENRLGAVLKHPTGHYKSRVTHNRLQRFNDQVITDGGVIYGPWLEGTSSRNRTTRFKGYKTFRRIRTRLRKQITPIAQANLDRLIGRLS